MFWPDVACYSGVWCHPRTASFFSSSYQLVAVSGLSTVDISYKAKILINFHEMAPPWTRRWPAFGWHCCRTPVFFAHLFQIIPDILTSENDQVTCCCLLQHNVSCGRGQNHQAYKQGITWWNIGSLFRTKKKKCGEKREHWFSQVYNNEWFKAIKLHIFRAVRL